MIAERSPQIRKAVARVMELSNDERTRLLMESRQKLEWDIQSREEEARNDERFIFAKNMLKNNEPIEKILMYTNLTHEEVEELRNAD